MDTASSSGGKLPHRREGKCNARMKGAEKKQKNQLSNYDKHLLRNQIRTK
jgi:hypothetical protein